MRQAGLIFYVYAFWLFKKIPILTVPFSHYLVIVIPLPPERAIKLRLTTSDLMCLRADTWPAITAHLTQSNFVSSPFFGVSPANRTVLGLIAYWAMNSSEEEEQSPFVLSSGWLLPQTQDHTHFISVSAITEMYNPFLISYSSPAMNCPA